ncbi:class I SAM-dependent methyltransferase, partial [Xanthomonas citri pv. mangiferaeindicae]
MSTVTVPPSAQPEEAFATRLAESGVLPDAVLRHGIRRLCAQRLRDERGNDADVNGERQRAFIDSLRASAIAIETDAANRQHYELPPQFFTLCLGRRLKYSSCYWDATTPNLDAAEERMLALYGERAELADGQRILELGCGWGSLTLWMAERYPNASITAVSNSRPQRAHILEQCRVRGLSNVQVITA